MKKLSLVTLLLSLVLLSGCGKKPSDSESATADDATGTRLVINQLDLSKRPFTVLAQHTSGRLLTFSLKNTKEINQATTDLEYLSGDLLKGARSTFEGPLDDPQTKSFLLGSCSAGGKCSFDRDLISGSLKLKLKIKGETDTHVLKGDYVFVEDEVTTTDGRVTYTSNGKGNQILLNTLGLPETVEGKVGLYPLAITSTSKNLITGKLKIRKGNVTKVMLHNGSSYQELDADIDDDQVTISLKHSPQKHTVKIIRDDLKGAEETHTFYLLGPIVLLSE
jgi:hypothetical protein